MNDARRLRALDVYIGTAWALVRWTYVDGVIDERVEGDVQALPLVEAVVAALRTRVEAGVVTLAECWGGDPTIYLDSGGPIWLRRVQRSAVRVVIDTGSN